MGLEGCSYIANLKKMQIVEQNVMYNLICVKNKEYVSIKTYPNISIYIVYKQKVERDQTINSVYF